MRPPKYLTVCLAVLLFAGLSRAQKGTPGELIDRHALAAPSEAEASLDKLAVYLFKPCKTDREKVRAIYSWITDRIAYDVEARAAGRPADENPAAVLKNRKATCGGYAQLFHHLSQLGGVQSVQIKGQGKVSRNPEPGYRYEPHR